MTWLLAPLVAAATSHDFAACARYLASFPEGTVLQRSISTVPRRDRRHFDGTDKILVVGQHGDDLFYVTAGDFARLRGVTPERLRVARVDAELLRGLEQQRRAYDLTAKRQPGSGPDRALEVGDLIARLGVWYVLHRPVNGVSWRFDAYRFNHVPRPGDRAQNLVTLTAGDYVRAGRALIGRHANVISVVSEDQAITYLEASALK